ncbi:MAG: nuclear transport factor 2 family protein [Deltaproteobacteria bacterium]|nr:nuclear transport factor 2 family protein [Deltaproteobacteria bacterium]MBW2362315.1 nuclear transport factor 2 family protein [Deltaproteobacteria bacterium]
MSTLEERVRAIEDREAIRELTARYCQCAVGGDAEDVVSLFTEDGVLDFGEIVEQGHDRLLALYRESFRAVRPIPFVHNHVVELDGDRATGYCSLELRMVENGEAVTAAGHYEDVFERVEGSWKFARRKLVFYHRVPLSQGWA